MAAGSQRTVVNGNNKNMNCIITDIKVTNMPGHRSSRGPVSWCELRMSLRDNSDSVETTYKMEDDPVISSPGWLSLGRLMHGWFVDPETKASRRHPVSR